MSTECMYTKLKWINPFSTMNDKRKTNDKFQINDKHIVCYLIRYDSEAPRLSHILIHSLNPASFCEWRQTHENCHNDENILNLYTDIFIFYNNQRKFIISSEIFICAYLSCWYYSLPEEQIKLEFTNIIITNEKFQCCRNTGTQHERRNRRKKGKRE